MRFREFSNSAGDPNAGTGRSNACWEHVLPTAAIFSRVKLFPPLVLRHEGLPRINLENGLNHGVITLRTASLNRVKISRRIEKNFASLRVHTELSRAIAPVALHRIARKSRVSMTKDHGEVDGDSITITTKMIEARVVTVAVMLRGKRQHATVHSLRRRRWN